jgi:AcrR family transcriptional regulator
MSHRGDPYDATVSKSTDPRALRSREAILNAARSLLVREGPGAVTHQRVAHEAGVGRATVYRHWPGADTLMLDVMEGSDLPFFKEPATPLRPWLRRELRALADELAEPAAAAFALTLMQSSIWDEAIASRRDQSMAAIITRLEAALTPAIARGELTTTCTIPEAVSLLIGPIVYHTAMQDTPVSDPYLDRILDTIGTWQAQPDRDASDARIRNGEAGVKG